MRPADVLKVAHHGSRTSSTPAFLDAAAPAFAVISVGFENSYGHPNREVLERLAARHAMTMRTDEERPGYDSERWPPDRGGDAGIEETTASSDPCASRTWMRDPGGAAAASLRIPDAFETMA